MSRDVGEATESLDNGLCYDYNYELCSFSNLSVTSPTSQLILQPFVAYLRHSSFSYPSVASPTSPFILQPFFRFSYVTSSSLNSPGESPMDVLRHFTYVTTPSLTLPSLTYVTAHSPTIPLLHLRHSSFSNPYFTSPTSRALHLIHLASLP